jgi:hypothetical protein
VVLSADLGNLTSILVKRKPFTPPELDRLEVWARDRKGFALTAGPGRNDERKNAYQAFLSLREARLERVFAARYPFDITPTVDDRPFFFRSSRWGHLVSGETVHQVHPPVMELSLLVLSSVIGVAVVLSVGLPLAALPSARADRGRLARYGLFFAAVGLGYLTLEIGFLQKFGLFLGHPNYALSAVLASLLFFSGLGSFVSEALVRRLGGIRFLAYALAGVMLLLHLAVFPLLPRLAPLSLAARMALVIVLLAPPGLLLGCFFPTALEALKREAPSFVPWAWGLNGVFSVLAPILAIAFSMTFGISALIVASLPIYLLAAWCLPDPQASAAAD